MTSYFDGELACIPRVLQSKDRVVFPTGVDVVMTERLIPPATRSDASKQPSTTSPHGIALAENS